MEKILLKSFDDPNEAADLQIALEQQGVKCELTSEGSTRVNLMGNDGIAGEVVSVYVAEGDQAAAQQVLEQLEREEAEKITFWCPDCGSEDLTKKVVHHRYGPVWQWVLAGVMLLLMIVIPIVLDGKLWIVPGAFGFGLMVFAFKGYDEELYHCNSCGKNFKRDN